MKTVYDVDVFLTTESPDDTESIMSGPLDGGFCETYAILDKLANECDGGWVDWEPYRCTYNFPSKNKSDEFCGRMVKTASGKTAKSTTNRRNG